MKRTLLLLSSAFLLWSTSCSESKKTEVQSASSPIPTEMKSYVSIFEIPATDISRAISFYQKILNLSIEKMDFPGLQLGLFPMEGQMVTGVIMQGEGYEPSSSGTTIYLNGGNDLQVILDKVVPNGGTIILPKTPHADEIGFFAVFEDSEGNKMGLHSPN